MRRQRVPATRERLPHAQRAAVQRSMIEVQARVQPCRIEANSAIYEARQEHGDRAARDCPTVVQWPPHVISFQ
jgi:hypothetical protein